MNDSPEDAVTPRDMLASYLSEMQGRSGYRTLRGQVDRHLLPALADVEDVRKLTAPMIRKLVLRTIPARARGNNRPLMPATLQSIYGTLRAAFGRLREDGLIDETPCRLTRRDFPPVDHAWRKTAFLHLQEAVMVMNDPAVAPHRRHLWTGLICTGMRHSEIAALNVADWDRTRRPLTSIAVSKAFLRGQVLRHHTKTGVNRDVPVIPFLARRLDAWLAHGFREQFGREPTFSDPLFPSRGPGRPSLKTKPPEPRRWCVSTAYLAWHRDLDALGLRRRRLHDLRRTWRTLARSAGVGLEFRDSVTHAAPKDVRRSYESEDWDVLCAEVSKLRFDVPPQLTLRLT